MGTVAVIGGGASGLVAALEAARASAEVLLFEANDRVGKSILATGNGRCNFSNFDVERGEWHNARFAEDVLLWAGGEYANRFKRGWREVENHHVIGDFFARLGLLWHEESEGRLYPLSNKASTILDLLRSAIAAYGIEERCGKRAVAVRPQTSKDAGGADDPTGFLIEFDDGSRAFADAVVIACGGRAIAKLASEGLRTVPQQPVLGPLRTDTEPLKGLNNIRVECKVSLLAPDGAVKATEEGEVLFRDYGISGIAVFNLSRHAKPGDRIQFDFVPWIRSVDFVSFLNGRWKRTAGAHGGMQAWSPTMLDWTAGILVPQVGRAVLKAAGLDPNVPINKADVPDVARALKEFSVEVRGIGDAKQCQVTRGGLDVRDFDARTLEARKLPGLFAAGEALDVDAKCGGFNLHWAWASGILAGRRAAEAAGAPKEEDHA